MKFGKHAGLFSSTNDVLVPYNEIESITMQHWLFYSSEKMEVCIFTIWPAPPEWDFDSVFLFFFPIFQQWY